VGLLISPDAPLADTFLCSPSRLPTNAYQCEKFQLPTPSSISFRDMEGVSKFDVEVRATIASCHTPYAQTFVCSNYLARSNSLPNFIIVALSIRRAVMRICICHRLCIIGALCRPTPKLGVFGVLRVDWRCENIVF